MVLRKVIFLLLGLFLFSNSIGQISFDKDIFSSNGPSSTEGHFVEQTLDGGYIIVASEVEDVFQGNNSNILLAKTDQYGDTIWTKTFGDNFTDNMRGLAGALTSDGGYAIAGCINCYHNPPDPKSKFLLIKTDVNGDSLWSQTYERDKRCWATWVEQTSDKGYILTGYGAATSGSADMWVVKTDSLGVLMWDKVFQLNGEDRGWCVRQTADGGYIVVGTSDGTPTDIMLIKLDSIGNTSWTNTIPGGTWGSWGDRFYEIEQTNDGGYILAGYADSAIVSKLDSNGNVIWSNGYDNVDFRSVQQTFDGGYIVAGTSWKMDAYGDIYLVKLNATGNMMWEKYFSNSDLWGERGKFVRQCTDSGYIVTGSDIQNFVLKLIKTFGDDSFIGLKDDMKVNQLNTLKVYPNPTSGKFFLSLKYPHKESLVLSITNLLGQEIYSKKLNSQTSQKELDMSGYPKGIYLLKISAKNQNQYKKIVLH